MIHLNEVETILHVVSGHPHKMKVIKIDIRKFKFRIMVISVDGESQDQKEVTMKHYLYFLKQLIAKHFLKLNEC